MKQLLICLLAATAFAASSAAHAQAATVKVDPKNNKVGKPVVDKPKVKLMTRDELRFCLVQERDLTAEAKDIKQTETQIVNDRTALKAQRAADDARDAELTQATPQLKLDIEALTKFANDFQADTKLDKAALKLKQDEYAARSETLQARIDAHNKALQDGRQARTAYNTRAEAFTAGLDAHNVRVEKHLDKYDAKDQTCKNKTYDEADEIAIKKEMAAKP